MKRLLTLLAVFFFLPLAASAWPQDALTTIPNGTLVQQNHNDQKAPDEIVNLQLTVYKIQGDISGDTSLTENIFGSEEQHKNAKEKGMIGCFIIADMTIAGVKFKASADQWTWDGEAEPQSDNIVIMARPMMLTTIPGNVEMQIGKQIEYMKSKPNALDGYEVVKTQEPIGIQYKANILPQETDGMKHVKIESQFHLSVVLGRKPLPLTELNVGEPIIDATNIDTTISVRYNSIYGFLITTKNGTILVKTKITKYVSE